MLQGLDAAQYLVRVSSSSSSAASIDSQQTGTSVSLRSNESSRTSDMRSDAERHIDEIFGDPLACSFEQFVPVLRRENLSELLEARLNVSTTCPRRLSMRADLGWWCPQLPFSLPTANEALLVPPKPYFGNVSEAYVREGGNKLDSCSRRKAGSERTPVLDDPEPYLPDDFFERLSVAQQPYEGLIPSR
jgi:hypothetical protein